MTDAKLDFWIQNNYNVLLCGKHGVGKSARIIEAFNRNNLKWLYFSAATLDPWVDFVGVPKETKDANGNTYLDLVRPKHFAEDEVEAIFMDEYNRAPAKIRNATMELLQFKSINGKKFKNLKMIWAAINPEKDLNDDSAPEYDVETLDPAQKDRFEIHVEVPYKPDITYFKNKYGDDIGKTAVSWWNDLNDKEKDEVSPRRLDYAIGLYVKNGDLRDVLNKKINVSKLVGELKNGNFREQMENIYKNRDLEKASSFIKDENSYNNTIKYILQDKNKLDFFFKYVPEEKQSNLVATDDVAMKYAFNNMDKYNVIVQRASIANTKIAKALVKWMKNKPMDVTSFENFSFSSTKLKFVKPPRAMGTSGYKSYTDMLNSEMTESTKGTAYRRNAFKSIAWALYNDKGYGNPTPTNPLTEKEAQLTLTSLNSLIDSIYQFDNFKELPQVYGLVCSEYLKRFGKKQTYNKLTRKVQEFLNLHGNLYI